jgi:hypothetical protein
VPEINENDDTRYAEQAIALSTNPNIARAGKAVALFAAGLALTPRLEWQDVFPNDFAAIACLARALRQLRAAILLMMGGYCAEVRPILRFAYETCGLARMLAHDTTRAEKWLRKMYWFPDGEVRRWFAGSGDHTSGQTPEEILQMYSTGYREMSRRSHPTALACLPALRVDERGPVPQLETVFAEEEFRACAAEICGAAIFACFTLRNAAVDQRAIHPRWRQDLYNLAREAFGSDMAHLERDWAEEQRQYEQLQQRVQSAAHLREKLQSSPSSWLNLREPRWSAEGEGSELDSQAEEDATAPPQALSEEPG